MEKRLLETTLTINRLFLKTTYVRFVSRLRCFEVGRALIFLQHIVLIFTISQLK